MLRTLLAAIGVVEVLFPEKLIDAAERLALENPGECEMESWVVPVARIEGTVFLVLAWRGDTSYSGFKKFLDVIGLLALLYPKQFIDYCTRIAYSDVESFQVKPWIYPFSRIIGSLYILIALNELRKD